jgi:protein-tyrosine phosphatase
VLPDGTELTAASFGSVDPYARAAPPDFGLYLDERWRPPWPHEHLDWPDVGVPNDPVVVVRALESLLDRARAGQRVEIGCYGGHGRTGTALACLAILCGQVPADAVSWVRVGYCERAIETDGQEAFACNFTG